MTAVLIMIADIEDILAQNVIQIEAGINRIYATFANYNRDFSDLEDWRRDNVNLFVKSVYDSINYWKSWVKLGNSQKKEASPSTTYNYTCILQGLDKNIRCQ